MGETLPLPVQGLQIKSRRRFPKRLHRRSWLLRVLLHEGQQGSLLCQPLQLADCQDLRASLRKRPQVEGGDGGQEQKEGEQT